MGSRAILVNASHAPSLIGFRGPLLAAMVAAGHRVHASAPDIDDGIRDKLTRLGVTPHDVPLSRTGLDPRGDLAYRRALRRLIRGHGIDLVLGYTIKPCIWGSLAAAAEGVESASLVTGLGYTFISAGLRQRLISAITRRLWRSATAANRVVIFQNPDDRDDFITAGALRDTSKARLVNGSGVDMEEFARAELPEATSFLMIARLLGNKGVREYGAAAARLIADGCPARFALAGYLDEGADTIARRELEAMQDAGIDYLGPLDDVRPALAEASVYVLPSYREGTPRTVLEAMAMGRAVITTDVPGCRETVAPGKTGLLVPARDVDALAAAMNLLATQGDQRARMGEAGYRLCRDKYAVEKVNAAMFEHLGLSVAGRTHG